ncbi:tRNA (N(6)-L-threonylcarbamoyladenosine(37)-C(2))-methylthiotransferase [Candidatus Nitrososphaera gargensis]|uniref:tRNA (N(6)-L-threonylcarbamoyladenosine(37)-C(2))- methylthiotransferase n=1 Tax=Candidatus Nitrososphaera gargensis TaxID=497727 RepID=UPI000B0C2A26|nr:tRNA (N(6)-L-threonylcarbamoyladenosine(37)-C(2))-methylthiotransferase [Candidatus Nitrososphaera gargensis]
MLRRSLKPALIESIPVLRRSKPKVWVEAYGCSASMADSEMISGLLKGAGYEIASKQSEGALNLIVTCSVKDTTEHRMVSRIKAMSKSGKPLVVAGCLPKADRAKVESLNSLASLLGPHSIEKAVDVVGSALAGGRLVALEDSVADKVNIPRVRLNPMVSIVEIASGCMSECTFCQTKIAKGWLRSYRIGDIMRQIKADINAGCKEVWLASTDNGCYGKDMGTDLVELLRACCSIEGDFKIRLGMMNPMYVPEMLNRMVDVFYENEKLFRFLHIPVESGSDRVLRKMKRGHTTKTFLDAVQAFRSKIPEMTISTDVIVGFPSETEDDFKETLDLVERAEPDIVNISRYSARPGTEAAKWKGMRVSSQVAKERSERLHVLAKKVAKKRNSLWQGWQGEIIIDEMGKVVQGRNYAYKPVVVLSSNLGKVSLGDRKRVQVYDFSNFSLKARIVI